MTLALIGVLIWFPVAAAVAQDPAAAPQDSDVESLRSHEAEQNAVVEAGRYRFTAGDGGDEGQAAQLVSQPVLTWSNPAAGSLHGSVFLWTEAGRPLVAGSLYQWFAPFTHRSHEFVSLATAPLRADYAGSEVWKTVDPGVMLAPLPEAPLPAASPALRLVQMRAMLRQFTATKVDREGMQHELRPLTQPVYRYRPIRSDLIDGALFVFVQGTDPELWLMLEARLHDRQRRWEFAAARMNSVDLNLRHNGKPIWQAEALPWGDVYKQRTNYTSFRFKEPVQ